MAKRDHHECNHAIDLLVELGVLMMMGIPLHQMSISGLVIAMGMLMDNAIVVMDEIERKLKEGKDLKEAILESCQFLFIPLIGSTLTTVFSFAPIASCRVPLESLLVRLPFRRS